MNLDFFSVVLMDVHVYTDVGTNVMPIIVHYRSIDLMLDVWERYPSY